LFSIAVDDPWTTLDEIGVSGRRSFPLSAVALKPQQRLRRRSRHRWSGGWGAGFGIIGDLIVGILGAFIGSWLLPQLGIHLGTGVISAIVNATIGAILLLLIVRYFGVAADGEVGGAAVGVGDGNASPQSDDRRV
jgi:uncharacterized membrane protein YeaQ/YmgE (transglycosylase-associated protein family)